RADLILHVVDASAAPDDQEAMMRAVDGVLGEIGAGERPRLLVLNKLDALDEDARRELFLRHPEAIQISAVTGEGLDALSERIDAALSESLREVRLLVP